MDEEEFIKPKNNIELGSNLDVLSVDELSEYIKNLQGEILALIEKVIFGGIDILLDGGIMIYMGM